MNIFLMLVCRTGGPISDTTRAKYGTPRCHRGLAMEWCNAGPISILVSSDQVDFRPSVVRWHSYLGVGVMRLDNRAEMARWAGSNDANVSDLELTLRVVAAHGARYLPSVLGDFAFVMYDLARHQVFGARDAFGVKRLYYTEDQDLCAFGSRAEALAQSDQFDLRSLVELVSVSRQSGDRTVYAGVHAVPAGHMVMLRECGLHLEEFWSAERFEPAPVPVRQERQCYETFRHLFAEAVRLRLTGSRDTWAQLSGGLDSSSVVSMAQHLAMEGAVRHGVAGTLSWVYRWSPDSDERVYSNVVAEHYRVSNQVLVDDWWWKDDHREPPLTDEPGPEYPLFARERRTREFLRGTGGRVLLTGFGSDHYLLGNMFFFADWIAKGRALEAIREMLRRSALGRVSFWQLAYRNALLPLLPSAFRRLLVPAQAMPTWIPKHVAKQVGVRHRSSAEDYAGAIGKKYVGLLHANMRSMPFTLGRHSIVEDEIEVRHPFLYRPLVEFSLKLPSEMCIRPHARKWVLREAMRGILPDPIRGRVGKGVNPGCILQSLRHERRRLDGMLRDPLLAQLGCVDATRLRAAYARAIETGEKNLVAATLYTLAVETWLQVRSGRWVVGGGTRNPAGTQNQAVNM